MMRRLLSIFAVAVVVGCSAGSTDSVSDSQAAWNDADVAFATGMIPHHEQALEMADLVAGKSVSMDVAMLADAIRAAQGPEISEMQGFLTEWNTTADPHAGHGGSGAVGGGGRGGGGIGSGDVGGGGGGSAMALLVAVVMAVAAPTLVTA